MPNMYCDISMALAITALYSTELILKWLSSFMCLLSSQKFLWTQSV